MNSDSLIKILDINISYLRSKKEVLEKIKNFLKQKKQNFIITPNPEILLLTHNNQKYKNILNKADLSLLDSIGLKFASLVKGKNIIRFTGADLIKEILNIVQKNKQKVAILNWEKGLSQKKDLEKYLLENKIINLVLNISRNKKTEKKILEQINNFQADVLFLTLGAPWQEKWINHNLKKISNIKIAVGIGGGFDFLTKKIKRAPNFFRYLGLEWLWRLIQQPTKRWKRIYYAVIKFPFIFCFKDLFFNFLKILLGNKQK